MFDYSISRRTIVAQIISIFYYYSMIEVIRVESQQCLMVYVRTDPFLDCVFPDHIDKCSFRNSSMGKVSNGPDSNEALSPLVSALSLVEFQFVSQCRIT